MSKKINFEKIKIIFNILNYNCIELLNINNLFKFFLRKIFYFNKIKLKFGIDPTLKSIHLGHVFYLKKLINLNKINKILIIFFIIGLITSYSNNLKIYNIFLKNINYLFYNLKYFYKFKKFFKLYYNSEWINILNLKENLFFLSLLNNKDFLKFKNYNYNYSIIQSIDSLFVRSDFEIGGLDQKRNFFFSYYFLNKFFNLIQFYFIYFLLLKFDFKKLSKSKKDLLFDIKILIKLFNLIINKNLLINYYKTLISNIKLFYIFISFKNEFIKNFILKIIIIKYFNFIIKSFTYYNKIKIFNYFFILNFFSLVIFKILKILKFYKKFLINKNFLIFLNNVKILNINFILFKNNYNFYKNKIKKFFKLI
ncbi:hypothetical protein NDNC_0020 [Candidatus Nasuia deltocephalinicola]|nr:hypothetical protein NDNC_0020 [Candidatus Nasuia deltocephalinicola]